MAADIPAGLGFLAAGLAFTAAEVALIRNHDKIGRWWIKERVDVAARSPRWRYPLWRGSWHFDVTYWIRRWPWAWIPAAIFLSLLAVVALGAAIAAFSR